MTQPFISVLLPSFNYRRYLKPAIESILSQSYSGYEIIAVDDGSSDGSWELLKEYEDRYPGKFHAARHPGGRNLGIVQTYRYALQLSKGTWIAFLEADDIWEKNNLELKIQAAESHPDCGVVYSSFRPFGQTAGSLYWNLHGWVNRLGCRRGPIDLFSSFLRRNPVASFSHFIIRRDLFEGVPALKVMRGFYDWWVLAHSAAQTPFYFIPEKLCRWRIHSESAAYGQPTKKNIFKLHLFLKRLYLSLEKKVVLNIHRRLLAGSFAFGRNVDARDAGNIVRSLFLHPLESLRFAGYFFLRHFLFVTKKLPA